MTKEWDVIVVGHTFVDYVFTGLPEWPGPGEEVFARDLRKEIGGAAITACGLGRLGHKVALLTSVGAEDSEWLLQKLEHSRVDTSLVRFSQQPTALTVSLSTTADRALFSHWGAAAELPQLLQEQSVRGTLARSGVLHFGMTNDQEQHQALFQELRAAGCLISMDTGWNKPWLQDRRTLALLQQTDFFLPNQKEAQLITGVSAPQEMLHWFAQAGLRGVALKLGPSGSVLLHAGNIYEQPSIRVDAVDTTGAGDCFNAGFIHSLLAGAPPQEWLRVGNLCGAFSTRAVGGVAGFPTLDEVRNIT